MSDWLLSKKKISLEKSKPDLNRMFDAGLPGGIGRPIINSGKITTKTCESSLECTINSFKNIASGMDQFDYYIYIDYDIVKIKSTK